MSRSQALDSSERGRLSTSRVPSRRRSALSLTPYFPNKSHSGGTAKLCSDEGARHFGRAAASQALPSPRRLPTAGELSESVPGRDIHPPDEPHPSQPLMTGAGDGYAAGDRERSRYLLQVLWHAYRRYRLHDDTECHYSRGESTQTLDFYRGESTATFAFGDGFALRINSLNPILKDYLLDCFLF